METFSGAEWVGEDGGPRVLLLSAELASGGRWVYRYSVSPGRVVSVLTEVGPGMLAPTDPVYAGIAHQLAGGQA